MKSSNAIHYACSESDFTIPIDLQWVRVQNDSEEEAAAYVPPPRGLLYTFNVYPMELDPEDIGKKSSYYDSSLRILKVADTPIMLKSTDILVVTNIAVFPLKSFGRTGGAVYHKGMDMCFAIKHTAGFNFCITGEQSSCGIKLHHSATYIRNRLKNRLGDHWHLNKFNTSEIAICSEMYAYLMSFLLRFCAAANDRHNNHHPEAKKEKVSGARVLKEVYKDNLTLPTKLNKLKSTREWYSLTLTRPALLEFLLGTCSLYLHLDNSFFDVTVYRYPSCHK